jgi:hypothetical protein
MKKILALLPVCMVLLISCSKEQAVQKASQELISLFPYGIQTLVSTDTDVVSMEYLVKHAEDYKSELFEEKFVIVKGKITDIDVTDYSKEDLSIMENKEAAELLSDVVSYDYYIDDITEPLTNNSDYLDIDESKEYYFIVKVSQIASSYSYIIMEAVELEELLVD